MEPEVETGKADLDDVGAVAALAEPLRRRLYEFASGHASGVTRDDAAEALGLARSVAAFHLDKLVAAGLLVAEHRRPAGRSGPGAGRPAKWYRRAEREVAVSVPERRYRLAAEILADAAEKACTGVPVEEALRDAAQGCGRRLANTLALGTTRTGERNLLVEVLAQHGYEPHRENNNVWLANCPFDALATGHRQLVCGMNLDLLRGLAEAMGLSPDLARLDPKPSRCCIMFADVTT